MVRLNQDQAQAGNTLVPTRRPSIVHFYLLAKGCTVGFQLIFWGAQLVGKKRLVPSTFARAQVSSGENSLNFGVKKPQRSKNTP